MKNLFKFVSASAVALALATSMSSQAATIGGITWDASSGINFSGAGSSGASWVASANSATPNIANIAPLAAFGPVGTLGTQYFEGVGLVNSINGTGGFCTAGSNCQLLYTFGGLRLDPNSGAPGNASGGAPSAFGNVFHNFFDGAGNTFQSAGYLNFYVYTPPVAANQLNIGNSLPVSTSISNLAAAAANDGIVSKLWLSMTFDSGFINLSSGFAAFTNGGMRITGGIAQPAFITGTVPIGFPQSPCPSGSCFLDDARFSTTSSGTLGANQFNPTTLTFKAATNNIPEPGTIALLGLALVGMGAMRRRKA